MTAPSFRIHIEVDTFGPRTSGVTSGVIYFDVGGTFFPARNWWDAPIVILAWWIDNLSKWTCDREIVFDFMEGDRSIVVSCNSEPGRIQFFRDGSCMDTIRLEEPDLFLSMIASELERCAALVLDAGIFGMAEVSEFELIKHHKLPGR